MVILDNQTSREEQNVNGVKGSKPYRQSIYNEIETMSLGKLF
jgi:hypothetical protein